MRQFTLISLTLILVLSNHLLNAQGCSDAGVCTINNIKDHSLNITEGLSERNFFKSGITYGIGDYNIKYINPYLEYTGILTSRVSLSGKITYAFISGELANTSNLGDFTFSSNFILYEEIESLLNVIVGFKIPLNDANMQEEDITLPMHYQSSLGTYDLILGANYSYLNFGASIAIQQPIINSNDNKFIKPTDQALEAYKYESTNSFERKGDVVLRLSYHFKTFENRFIILPGILGIYHLGNDSYIDDSGIEQEIVGSKGLTLNGNLFLSYRFNESKRLELSVGTPFISREARPDGLTRKAVMGLEYTYSF